MNKKLYCSQVIQQDNRGIVHFVEKDKEGKVVCNVIINYTDSKEAGKYQQGTEYTITIKK